MGAHRSLRHAAALAAIGALLAAVSCLDPTEVTLVITTDVQCLLDRGTSITVGSATDNLSRKPPLTVTQDCTSASQNVDDSGALASPANIGTLVVVPSGSKSDSFAVRVIMAVDPNMSPMDCLAPAYTNCIVADREVSFIPHTPITLPIEITLDCKNIVCSKGLTCVHGQCAVDTVTVNCTGGGGCNGVIPPDASTESPDSGGPPDVSMEPPTQDARSSDQFADQTLAEADTDVQGNDATLDDVADATNMDVTPTDSVPDGLSDSTVQDASMLDSSLDAVSDTADASLADASDVSVPDAPRDVSTGDVGADAGTDADAAQPSDGGLPSDGSPLGTCVSAGASTGVECANSTCAPGMVCCVTFYPGGGVTTEACSTLATCNYSSTSGSPVYSALACRNRGDCPTGQVCCGSASGGGTIAQCVTSCPYVALGGQTPVCRNSCECPSAVPTCNAKTCLGYTVGLCGGAAGSTCL